ncbi:MAG TPA: anti-sigma factor [Pseudoxanthomonas sp.]
MNLPGERFDDESCAAPPSDDLRAGEYVLGVLDDIERRETEARIVRDLAFAHLVQRWEEHFAPWLERVDAVTPGARVWPRIRTRLGWKGVEVAKPGAWNSVGFWRGVAALATAASIAAVVFGLRPPAPAPVSPPFVVVQPPQGEEQTPRPVTVLTRDDGSIGWIATLAVAGDKVLMVPVPSAANAAGWVNELWIIPEGAAPISLGFVSNEKAHSIQIPAAIRQAIEIGSTFAVTLEPESGMPHDAPSGPVVAKGGIQHI